MKFNRKLTAFELQKLFDEAAQDQIRRALEESAFGNLKRNAEEQMGVNKLPTNSRQELARRLNRRIKPYDYNQPDTPETFSEYNQPQPMTLAKKLKQLLNRAARHLAYGKEKN